MCENDCGQNNEINICKKIEIKLLSDEKLDASETEHIKNCSACRTYSENVSKMLSELSELNVDTLEKDGVSLSDSVMKEIGYRKLFAGRGFIDKPWVKHLGLVAACVVIAVMAIPAVWNYNADKKMASDSKKESTNMNFASPRAYSVTSNDCSESGEKAVLNDNGSRADVTAETEESTESSEKSSKFESEQPSYRIKAQNNSSTDCKTVYPEIDNANNYADKGKVTDTNTLTSPTAKGSVASGGSYIEETENEENKNTSDSVTGSSGSSSGATGMNSISSIDVAGDTVGIYTYGGETDTAISENSDDGNVSSDRFLMGAAYGDGKADMSEEEEKTMTAEAEAAVEKAFNCEAELVQFVSLNETCVAAELEMPSEDKCVRVFFDYDDGLETWIIRKSKDDLPSIEIK